MSREAIFASKKEKREATYGLYFIMNNKEKKMKN